MAIALRQDSYFDKNSEFRATADKITALASKYDIKIKGYHDADLPLFNALSSQKQNEVLLFIKMYHQSLVETEAAGERLDNNAKAIWCSLSSMGLMPPSELFSKFTPAAAIEIYDTAGLQIWRNFNTMKYCSYTLEEIYSIEWFNRYARDADKTTECFAKVGALLEGKTPAVFYPDIASHILEETCSIDKLKLEVHYDLFSILKNRDGKIAAWLVMSTANIIHRRTDAPQRRILNLVSQNPYTEISQ